MPAHDWTRVDDGIFHAFHNAWIAAIQQALNSGRLPDDYYALSEQVLGGLTPDVLTLHSPTSSSNGAIYPTSSGGTLAVATAPPRVQVHQQAQSESYTQLQRTLVIRHNSGDRVVALIEILGPGNKAGQFPLQQLVNKSLAALSRGIHLLILDLIPPGPRDPNGIHGVLWGELTGAIYTAPTDAPLTLAAYSAGLVKEAFVEPLAVGTPLVDMPLFLMADEYVPVPLEATYLAAFAGLPARFRQVLER